MAGMARHGTHMEDGNPRITRGVRRGTKTKKFEESSSSTQKTLGAEEGHAYPRRTLVDPGNEDPEASLERKPIGGDPRAEAATKPKIAKT